MYVCMINYEYEDWFCSSSRMSDDGHTWYMNISTYSCKRVKALKVGNCQWCFGYCDSLYILQFMNYIFYRERERDCVYI